jgi:hypothetical protein
VRTVEAGEVHEAVNPAEAICPPEEDMEELGARLDALEGANERLTALLTAAEGAVVEAQTERDAALSRLSVVEHESGALRHREEARRARIEEARRKKAALPSREVFFICLRRLDRDPFEDDEPCEITTVRFTKGEREFEGPWVYAGKCVCGSSLAYADAEDAVDASANADQAEQIVAEVAREPKDAYDRVLLLEYHGLVAGNLGKAMEAKAERLKQATETGHGLEIGPLKRRFERDLYRALLRGPGEVAEDANSGRLETVAEGDPREA